MGGNRTSHAILYIVSNMRIKKYLLIDDYRDYCSYWIMVQFTVTIDNYMYYYFKF